MVWHGSCWRTAMKTMQYRTRRTIWFASLVVFSVALLSWTPAWARDFNPRRGVYVSRVWVEPVYETRSRVQVIPAEYDSIPRQVWHEPVYEDRPYRVEIPAEVVRERIPRYDRRGRRIGYEIIERVVRPARTVWKTERVMVRPGYYETVYDRVCVRPESTRTIYDRVLVRPGHWALPRFSDVLRARSYQHRAHLHRVEQNDPGVRLNVRWHDDDDD